MFDASRAFEVISRPTAADGRIGYGSGYYLGAGIVITCAHLLTIGGDLTVRGIAGQERRALVAWRNVVDDVALLVVDERGLPGGVVPICRLPRITHDVHARFVMFGWPRVGDVGSKRNPVQVNGSIKLAEVAVAAENTGTVRLRPGEGTATFDMWRGMSGAAVFCEHSLIAVQTLQPDSKVQYLEGRLLAEEVLRRLDEHGRSGHDQLASAGIPVGVAVPSLQPLADVIDSGDYTKRLPADIISKMERFGRYDVDPIHGGFDISDMWASTFAPLYEFAQLDPEAFVQALAEAVRPVGGWALYGAAHTVKELLGFDYDSTTYRELLKSSLGFLRSRGLPNLMLKQYEWWFWLDVKDTDEQWLTGRRQPTPSEAPITELRRHEVRRVAQAFRDYDSPVVFVSRADKRSYVALVETRIGDDDPRRSKHEWKRATTLNDLYWIIGTFYQVPTYWYDVELGPFFPLPRPRFD